MPRDWHDYLASVTRWVIKETAISVRVLRLRSYLYLKIPWIDTFNMVKFMLAEGVVCEVPSEESWLTVPEYLDSDGHFLDGAKDEFEQRKKIYSEWNRVSQNLGYYAETLFQKAFLAAGYSVQKATFQTPPSVWNPQPSGVEIDIYCMKDEWHLGVQVKNVTSDVFVDPSKINTGTEIYEKLMRQFDFCKRHKIIPILISPFIDGSFYCVNDRYKGLHCQTLVQLFSPENEGVCKAVKEVLRFGNVRVVEQVPEYIRNWIDRIPEIWTNRHS